MYKTANEIARRVLVKVGFSITEEGHKYDAESAEAMKRYLLDRARQMQEARTMGYRDPEGGGNPVKVLKSLAYNATDPVGVMGHPTDEARHMAYVAQKHREGKNAWNPWGGYLTPLPEEEGATPGLFGTIGKVRPEEEKNAESMDMEGATPEEFRDFQLRNIARMRGPLATYGAGMGAIGGTALGGVLGKGKGALLGAGIGAATGLGTALGANEFDTYVAQNATAKKMQDNLREHQEEIQDMRDAGVDDFEINPNHARNRLIGSSILGALTGAATGGGIGLHGGRGLAGAGIGALAGAGTGLGFGALGNMYARGVEAGQEKLSSRGLAGLRSMAKSTRALGATPGAAMQPWYTAPMKSVEDRVAGAMRIKAQEALKANQHRMVPGSARV